MQGFHLEMNKTATIPIEASLNTHYWTCRDFLCVSDDQSIVLVHDYGRPSSEA